ncbi:unnamed protein product [Discosporangium mesarthrocarpum]
MASKVPWDAVVPAVVAIAAAVGGIFAPDLLDYIITFLQFLYFEHQWVIAVAMFYSFTRCGVLAETSLVGAFAPFKHVGLAFALLLLVAALQPANRTTLIHQLPLLTEDECDWIVQAANRNIEAIGGWTSGRHRAYPTEDVPVAKIPDVDVFLRGVLEERILPAARDLYSLGAKAEMELLDMFLVRYSLEGQRSLDSHVDSGHLSFDIMLTTNGTDFRGGGVHYKALGETLSPPKGSVIIHPAKLVHAGVEITEGWRYVVVGFTRVVSKEWWDDYLILPWRLWGYLTGHVGLRIHDEFPPLAPSGA